MRWGALSSQQQRRTCMYTCHPATNRVWSLLKYSGLYHVIWFVIYKQKHQAPTMVSADFKSPCWVLSFFSSASKSNFVFRSASACTRAASYFLMCPWTWDKKHTWVHTSKTWAAASIFNQLQSYLQIISVLTLSTYRTPKVIIQIHIPLLKHQALEWPQSAHLSHSTCTHPEHTTLQHFVAKFHIRNESFHQIHKKMFSVKLKLVYLHTARIPHYSPIYQKAKKKGQ